MSGCGLETGGKTSFFSCLCLGGGAFAQAPLTFLVTWFTWTATFMSIGLLTLLLGSAILLAAANRPDDKGFSPISVIPNREKQAGIAEGMKGVLSCKHIYPVLVVNFCANGIFAATTWGPYMTDCFGLSSAEAGSITFFIPLVAAITALLCGQISDRIANRKLVNLLMSTLNMLALFLLYLDWSGGTSLLTCGSLIIFSGSTMFCALTLAW